MKMSKSVLVIVGLVTLSLIAGHMDVLPEKDRTEVIQKFSNVADDGIIDDEGFFDRGLIPDRDEGLLDDEDEGLTMPDRDEGIWGDEDSGIFDIEED